MDNDTSSNDTSYPTQEEEEEKEEVVVGTRLSKCTHPDQFVLPNRVVFPQWVYEQYRGLLTNDDDARKTSSNLDLFKHQVFVREYMRFETPFKGLLMYHGLGVGKTCSAIAVAEIVRNDMRVIVLVPASLRGNFQDEMTKCGHRSVVKAQRWRRVPASKQFVVDDERGAPYADLSEEDRALLDRQIKTKIEQSYTFLNYNGVHTEKLVKMAKGFFDNALIIVDEAHRFVSPALKPGSTGNLLYNMVWDAVGSKVLLLSGTPIINSPFELSLLLNLAHGKKNVFTARVDVFGNKDRRAALAERLADDPYVDEFRFDGSTLKVSMLPLGYRYADKRLARIEHSVSDLASPGDQAAHVKRLLGSATTTKVQVEQAFHFPMDKDEFDGLYVDHETNSAVNRMQFLRRIQGLVSYFHKRDAEVYPTQRSYNIVRLDMTTTQFNGYSKARIEEIKRESLASRFAAKNRSAAGAGSAAAPNTTYKAFSRAACNFVFPVGINRPYPSKMKEFVELEELVDDAGGPEEGDDNDAVERKRLGALGPATTYAKALASTLEKLSRSDAMLPENLPEHSPKMAALVAGVERAAGPCLVYSQFSRAEGVGILAMAMEAAGFQRMTLHANGPRSAVPNGFTLRVGDEEEKRRGVTPRSPPAFMVLDTSDRSKAEILRGIFNSDRSVVPKSLVDQVVRQFGSFDNSHGQICKAILITASGAEGISLKNVREVHLLEPFWNNVRVKQVVGRAIRAHSHSSLPREERIVDVFVYVMQLRKEQRELFLIKARDEGFSSDEMILNIAERKQKLTDDFQNMLRAGAVDCNIHESAAKNDRSSSHGDNCFNHDSRVGDEEFAHTVEFQMDTLDEPYGKGVARRGRPKGVVSEIGFRASGSEEPRRALLLEGPEGTLIDAEIYRVLRRHRVVGRAVFAADGSVAAVEEL